MSWGQFCIVRNRIDTKRHSHLSPRFFSCLVSLCRFLCWLLSIISSKLRNKYEIVIHLQLNWSFWACFLLHCFVLMISWNVTNWFFPFTHFPQLHEAKIFIDQVKHHKTSECLQKYSFFIFISSIIENCLKNDIFRLWSKFNWFEVKLAN